MSWGWPSVQIPRARLQKIADMLRVATRVATRGIASASLNDDEPIPSPGLNFAAVALPDVQVADSILKKHDISFVLDAPNPCEKLSDPWYSWEIFSRMIRAWMAIKRGNSSDAAKEALLLGKFIKEFQANCHKIVVHGEKDLQDRRKSGRKGGSSRWCRIHNASSTACACPPWREAAHKQNALLLKKSPSLSSMQRASRIAKKLGLAERTVRDEIASPKFRERYQSFYM